MYITGDRGYQDPRRFARESIMEFDNIPAAVLFVVACIATIIWIVLAAWFGTDKVYKLEVEESFNVLSQEERRAFAEDVVNKYDKVVALIGSTNSVGENVIIDWKYLTESDMPDIVTMNIDQWQMIAETGDELHFDILFREISMWAVFFGVLLGIWLAAVLMYYLVCLPLLYLIDCVEYDRFMIDMPLDNIYCWVLLVTTLLLGWPFYLVSAIRLYLFKKQRQAEAAERANHGETETPVEEEEEAIEEVAFEDQPEDARELYVFLRQEGWENYLLSKLKSLEQDETKALSGLRDLGGKMVKKQEELEAIRTKKNQVTMSYGEFKCELDEAAIRAEFDEIREFRNVEAVRVQDNRLSVRVNVRLPYHGKAYDMGDWELLLSPDAFVHRCLRRGTIDESDGNSPIYTSGNGFCFGNSQALIHDNLNKGQIAHAIEIAVCALHSFNNEGDRRKIPVFFKEVKE